MPYFIYPEQKVIGNNPNENDNWKGPKGEPIQDELALELVLSDYYTQDYDLYEKRRIFKENLKLVEACEYATNERTFSELHLEVYSGSAQIATIKLFHWKYIAKDRLIVLALFSTYPTNPRLYAWDITSNTLGYYGDEKFYHIREKSDIKSFELLKKIEKSDLEIIQHMASHTESEKSAFFCKIHLMKPAPMSGGKANLKVLRADLRITFFPAYSTDEGY